MARPPVLKNDIVTLSITDITNDGSGIGKIDSFAIFVPYTAIGDVILAKIISVKKSFAYAKIHEIITPSTHRTQNDCPVFSKCGGCSLRHLKYSSELEVKEKSVRDNVLKFSGQHPVFESIIPSPKTLRYRNKAVYPVGVDSSGNPVVGFYARRSHRIVTCDDCLIQPQEFTKIARGVLDICNRYGISPYNELDGRGMLRHIFLRQDTHSGSQMLCLVVNLQTLPNTEDICSTITIAYPEIKTIVLNHNTERGNIILGKKNTVIYGDGSIDCKLCSLDFEVSPQSFFQINTEACELLYEKAEEYAELKNSDTLLDLYCGTGTIGLNMSNKVKKLIGVEVVSQAIENAKNNAYKNSIENAEFICIDAAQAASQIADSGEVIDVVLLDPPRSGCDAKTIEAVSQMSPRTVVYISCNSATLARDIGRFSEYGYKAQKICPVDMFPRTPHVECVCLISKAE